MISHLFIFGHIEWWPKLKSALNLDLATGLPAFYHHRTWKMDRCISLSNCIWANHNLIMQSLTDYYLYMLCQLTLPFAKAACFLFCHLSTRPLKMNIKFLFFWLNNITFSMTPSCPGHSLSSFDKFSVLPLNGLLFVGMTKRQMMKFDNLSPPPPSYSVLIFNWYLYNNLRLKLFIIGYILVLIRPRLYPISLIFDQGQISLFCC